MSHMRYAKPYKSARVRTEQMKYEQILEMIRTTWQSRIIMTAIELHIPDILTPAAKSAEEVADSLGADLRATRLLLNALTGMNILEKHEDRYSNTEETAIHLVRDSAEYGGNGILHHNQLWKSWSDLTNSVLTGTPSPASGRRSNDDYSVFVSAMDDFASARATEVSKTISIDSSRPFLDLGGGPGTYTIAFLKAHRNLRASIYDRPQAIAVAMQNCMKHKVESLVGFIKGDFMTDPIPGRYGTIWASHIIHAYGEEDNRRFLRKIYEALEPEGKLYLQDFYLDDTMASPTHSAVFAINMLVHTKSGRSFSRTEVTQWLAETRFKKISVEPSPPGAQILVATR